MRYERTLRNEAQGEQATLRLDGKAVVRYRGTLRYPLQWHQLKRLRRLLNKNGTGALGGVGLAGESPEVQECPETPGWQARIVEKKTGPFFEEWPVKP